MRLITTTLRFETSKSTLGAVVGLTPSAALAIGFVSTYWRASIDAARLTADVVACGATSGVPCRDG